MSKMYFAALALLVLQANADILMGNFFEHRGQKPDLFISYVGSQQPATRLSYGVLAQQNWDQAWLAGKRVTFTATASIGGSNIIVAQSIVTYKTGSRPVFIVGPEVAPSTNGGYMSEGGFESSSLAFLQEKGSSLTNPGYVVNVAPASDLNTKRGQKEARFRFNGPTTAEATAAYLSFGKVASAWEGITTYGYALQGTPDTMCSQFQPNAATQFEYFTAVAYATDGQYKLTSWPTIATSRVDGCMAVGGGDAGDSDDDSSSSSTVVIAIVVGALLVAISAGVYFFAFRLKKKAENDAQLSRQNEAEQAEEAVPLANATLEPGATTSGEPGALDHCEVQVE